MTANALAPGGQSRRSPSIDLLRALVMVVMVLDHARDFVHEQGLSGDPTDPDATTPALFFTRWITHFCAPVFVFLAGLSVQLQLLRGADMRVLGGKVLRRGFALVLLELVVLRPLIWFQLDYSFAAHLQVIWAIGWSFVALGALLALRVPTAVAGALGGAIVVGHGLIPALPFQLSPLGSLASLRVLLLGRGPIELWTDGPIAFAQYAIVPWLGVMLLGFAVGRLYALDAARTRRWLFALGVGACVAFGVLRAAGGYGDPRAWAPEADPLHSLYVFLRVEKYPPSLQYCLMTLGPALLVLAATMPMRADGWVRVVVRLGRVPLFFYVLQWPAVHLVSRLFQWIDGQPIGWDAPNPLTSESLPPACGFSLGVVYLAWLVALAMLVPVSLWHERRGGRRRARMAVAMSGGAG